MENAWDLYMKEAINEAKQAEVLGEVPIGAVIVRDGRVIARGHNLRETTKDPTNHAEIVALRRASEVVGGWRLSGCTLVVTLEPCPRCAGAIVQSRIDRLVFGTADPKAGCAGTLMNLLTEPRFNHQVIVVDSVMQQECAEILSDFFRKLRNKN